MSQSAGFVSPNEEFGVGSPNVEAAGVGSEGAAESGVEQDGEQVLTTAEDLSFGDGWVPTYYLWLQDSVAEAIVVTQSFHAADFTLPLVVLLLPARALGRKRGTAAGPLLGRVSSSLDGWVDADSEPTVLENILTSSEVEDRQLACTSSFVDADGGQLNFAGSLACEVGVGAASGWAEDRQNANAKAQAKAPARAPARRLQLSPLLARNQVQRKTPGQPIGVPDLAKLEKAGIDKDSAIAIQGLLGGAPSRMKDPVVKTRGAAAQAVAEADEEDDAIEEAQLSQQDLLTDALLKLSETLSEMKVPKKPSGVEAVLGSLSVSTSAGDSAGVSAAGPSRRNAQARLALRSALREQPSHFYVHIEGEIHKRVGDILHSHRDSGASSSSESGVPFRTYIEHRAFLNGHRATNQWMWLIGGIGEALSAGKVEEARARVSLALVYGEQLCIDAGNTTLATELLFEEAMPTLPVRMPEAGTSLWPRIVSDVWGEVVLGHVRDRLGSNTKLPP